MKVDISIPESNATEDLVALIDVFEDVFGTEHEERPSAKYLQNLLSKETFFAVVAKVNEQIVGGLTVYVLDQYYSSKPVAYIYDLAVLTQFQRKGIGKYLIKFTREYCRDKGFDEVFVQVDKVDLFALEFYRATRPSSEEPVVHFTYDLGNDNSGNGNF